jgi:hypothetical protein
MSFDPKQLAARAAFTVLNSSSNYQGLEQTTTSVGGQKSNQSSTLLRYPLENLNAYPATMIFEPYIVDAYKVSSEGLRNIMDAPLISKYIRGVQAAAAALGSASDEVIGAEKQNPYEDPILRAGKKQKILEEAAQANAQAKRNEEIENNKKEMGSKLTDLRAYRDEKAPGIALYLPPALQYIDNVTYNAAQLGAAGQTALAGLNSGGAILGALGKGIAEGAESIFNLARGTLSQQAAQVAAARAANLIPNQGLQAAAGIGLQTGLNPGTRILFETPTARQFVFNFKLIATSSAEARSIEQIVKNFRLQLYPREIDINNIPIGYEFPNVFRISFKFGAQGQQPHIPRLQYCYLQSINTSYNGQADVFYQDGHPTEVDLSLNFVEYRPLSKRDVEAGF